MVTNYFTGELLSEKIFREGKVAVEEAVSIFTGILEGLKYLHHMRLIHNDITPKNVMLRAILRSKPDGDACARALEEYRAARAFLLGGEH